VSPCTPSLWSRLPLSRSASLAHHAYSGKMFLCLDLWLGNDHLITSSFVLVPLESLKQAFLISRRCAPLGGLKPPNLLKLTYDDYDVTSDRRFTHTRDRRTPSQHLATTQTSRRTSLLSARCPIQHAYIIACCHVITPDYLVGTQAPQS